MRESEGLSPAFARARLCVALRQKSKSQPQCQRQDSMGAKIYFFRQSLDGLFSLLRQWQD